MTSEKTVAFSKRVSGLLGQMTLEEKVSLLSGRDMWSLNSVERLGIPSLTMSDGPTGLRSSESKPATVFPVGVCVAATWDRELVHDMSAAIGREAIAYGVDVLLAPTVNIQRTPLGGRNFECYSEDPFLASQIGTAYVQGVQSEGVGTSLKHYVANNQEYERMRYSANIGKRALREIYLSAFEPVVKDARPWTVMSAYNRINGTYASEHNELLNEVLKDEWGFDGIVVSDWTGTKSTVGAANGGLDLEMPGPGIWFGNNLIGAAQDGLVSETTIDDHAGRILHLIERCGLFDDNPKTASAELSSDRHRELARDAAAAGMVLLKNERDLLPLKTAKAIAVIGAGADLPTIQGGGSSQVAPDRIVTPLEALLAEFGRNANIRFERGIDHEPKPPTLDGRLLSPETRANSQGLRTRYFANANCEGDVVQEEVDWRFSKLGFGEKAQKAGDGSFSVEWTGVLVPRYSGEHVFQMRNSPAGVELSLDGEALIDAETPFENELLFMLLPLQTRRASIELEAGNAYPITVRYKLPAGMGIPGFNMLNLGLREPEPEYEAALNAARDAEVALVFVGSGTTAETEGEDRQSMALSDEQNQLVRDCLAANPNTVVIVNTGAPVEMPWADEVPAIVQMWLPGQEGGAALADILSGAVNPSGKLPLTFPRRYKDNPTYPFYPGGDQADYGEDLFVGYRYYDKIDCDPLFPFGHGLSYSRFAISNCQAPDEAKAGETVELSVDLQNVGDFAGAEVVQIYVSNHASGETMPVRELRAFEKAHLEAGETKTLSFAMPARAFSWFDPDRDDWVVTPGKYLIGVGRSSRDIVQNLELTLT